MNPPPQGRGPSSGPAGVVIQTCCRGSSAGVTHLTSSTAGSVVNTAGGPVSSPRGAGANLPGELRDVMTFADVCGRPLRVLRGAQQGAAARLHEGSPLPVRDMPTQALSEASLVPFHQLLSHCCSPSQIMKLQTGSVLRASLAHLNTGFSDDNRRRARPLPQGHGCVLRKTVITSLWKKSWTFNTSRPEPGSTEQRVVKNLGDFPS